MDLERLKRQIRECRPARNNRAVGSAWAVKDIEDNSLYGLFDSEAKAEEYIGRHWDGEMLFSSEEVIWG